MTFRTVNYLLLRSLFFKLFLLLFYFFFNVYLWFSNFSTLKVPAVLVTSNSELLIHSVETGL